MESNVAFGDDPERFATAFIPMSGGADRSLPELIAEGRRIREVRDEMQTRFGRSTPMDFVIVAVEEGRGEVVRQEIENKVLLKVER